MRTIKFLLGILFSITVAACGGGGGSTPPPPPPAATTYSISGTVTGPAGVTVTLSGTSAATTTTIANGTYTFSGLANGSYTVKPTLTGYAFSPASLVVSVSGANVTGKNFTATAAANTYSISGTVSGAATSGVTIDLGTAGSTQTIAGGTYTISGLIPGSYTVTPTLSGFTFNPASSAVTISSANVTGKDFAATTYTGSYYTISGTVTGPYVEGVTITLSGAGAGTATTNASGAYSFTNRQTGTYILTPSLAGYSYTPSAPSVPVSANTTQNFTAASTITAYSVSGTVTVSTAKTGTIYLRVYNTGWSGSNTVAGTSIATTGGAYTIRGLQPGSYTVNAEMDALGTGARNAGNPAGTSAPITITSVSGSASVVNVTVVDPTTPVPVTPPTTKLGAFPSSSAAFISWDTPRDVNGTEIASSYQIYWGTDTAATNGAGSPIIVPARDNGFYVQSGLTNGTTLYYKISALAGGTESATSTVIGPVIINATTGSNTLSGTVSYTGTATGSLYVGAYSDTTGVYFTRIASPGSYSIAGIPNGSYGNFAFIDVNSNGTWDIGDIGTDGDSRITVNTATTTNNLTLSAAFATASVSTNHGFDGTGHWYDVNPQVRNGTKRVVAVTLLSGLNAPVPLDLGKDWEYRTWASFGATSPTVGSSYLFKVTYSDGTTENLTSSVTAVLGIDAMAQNLTVSQTPSANIPTFSWTSPSAPPVSYTYGFNLNGSNANWYLDNDLPSTTLNLVYNADGRANPTSLTTGNTYSWQVQVRDANRNSASRSSTYIVP